MTNRKLAEIVMRQNPAKLSKDATVKEACRLMRDRRVGAILVVGEGDELVGLFTGRDAVARVVAESLDPDATALSKVMTANPDTIGPNAHAVEALRMMQDGGYRHLPILDAARIVGIVSRGDFCGLECARLDDETGIWEIL